MADRDKANVQPFLRKGLDPDAAARLRLAAVGLEAEFNVVVDGEPGRPEDVFGTPLAFLPKTAMHRTGTSYSLPTGGAVYFDTGVIEVATPVIEVARGCMARAGRSLWEAISHVRAGLDGWERRTGRSVRLVGFSTHYNVSFTPTRDSNGEQTVERLAELLVRILPVPVMLLAANKRSTGIGVRPRGNRIEVTADFTPSAALMIAAGTVVTGVTRAVMRWPDYRPERLDRAALPHLEVLRPRRHTSRKGWLAHKDDFPHDPIAGSPDEARWEVSPAFFRGTLPRPLSLREIGCGVVRRFARPIRSVSDAATYRLVDRVMRGVAPSLLDLPDRPAAYENVGRECLWDDLFPERILRRSRYERVLIRAIAGVPFRLDGRTYRPVGLQGWSEVVFRAEDGTLHAFPLDFLLHHLGAWEREPLG